MSDSREPASTNLPEWRRNAKLSGNSQPLKQFARRPKVTARWKNHRFIRDLPREVRGGGSGAHPTGPTPKISLESLGSDLWFLISSYVPKSTLLSICQASPTLHTQVIPVLYHSIDLSTHAPPEDFTVSFRYRRTIYERQYMFTRQISQKPHYGQYVRSLKWTLGVECEQFWSVACNDYSFRPECTPPTSLQTERVVWRSSENVGKLFECLTQVVNLDVEWANKSGGRILVLDGKSLFPAVQKVKLGSTLNVSAILSGANNTPLSILQLGPYAIARPDFSGLTTRNTPSPVTSSPATKSKKYADILHPSFQLRCKDMHTLFVTLQHLSTRSEVRDFYTALASFILNIRPRSFIFILVGINGQPLPQPTSAHLRHKGHTCPRCNGPMVVGLNGRLTHLSSLTTANLIPEHFKQNLLPLLMQGWEGLQRVEIRGVMKSFLVDMRRELKGRGVVLAGDGWEEEWASDENETS